MNFTETRPFILMFNELFSSNKKKIKKLCFTKHSVDLSFSSQMVIIFGFLVFSSLSEEKNTNRGLLISSLKNPVKDSPKFPFPECPKTLTSKIPRRKHRDA